MADYCSTIELHPQDFITRNPWTERLLYHVQEYKKTITGISRAY